MWFPKSAIFTEEEKQERKLREAKQRERFIEKQAEGLERYNEFVSWAKSTGVKGIKYRMKRQTILRLLTRAGITIPVQYLH